MALQPLLLTTLLLNPTPLAAVEIPSDVTPGYPESATPWWDSDDFSLHLTSTTGANFGLSMPPALVDAEYNWWTGEFEVTNVCDIPEAVGGLSGSIVTERKTILMVAPDVGLIDIDPLTCDYEIVATGFLPAIDLGGGIFAPGLANDVVADWDGNVYVSDSLFGVLYRWDGSSSTIDVLAATPEMGQPDPQGLCQMPPALSFAPYFGINGLRLDRTGNKLYFAHTLPRGMVYTYDLRNGSVQEFADLGCDVAPDELHVLTNGNLLVSLAFDVVLDENFALESLGSIVEVSRFTREVVGKAAGPFEFSDDEENPVTRTFGGPAAIHCLQWPLSGQCAVANHYADQVGQPFEIFWFDLGVKTWPEARPH